jgi:hypothetical protein
MGVVLLVWGIVLAACQGWGALLIKTLNRGQPSVVQGTRLFWIGFGVLLGMLQVWHLFLPVDWLATVILLGCGVTIWCAGGCWKSWRPTSTKATYLFVFFFVGLWLANRGLDFVNNYDSGLYHFAMIRWINEYPIIPGLANLHERLGFNQSYFLFVALLNAHPFFNQGYHVTNSLLVFVLSAQLLGATWKTIVDPFNANIVAFLQCLLFPIVVAQGLTGNISSPSPDLAVFVCSVAAFTTLVETVMVPQVGSDKIAPALLSLILLSVATCTLKLSATAFAGATVCVIFGSACKLPRQTLRIAAGCTALLVVPYAIRGFIQSGYPAFPGTFSPKSVDWRLPIADTRDTANWICSWARMPGHHWREVLGSWNWLPSWYKRILSMPEVFLPVVSAGGGIALLLISIGLHPAKRNMRSGWWRPAIPVIVGIAWWFFTAPDPRFALGLFWLAAVWPFAGVLSLNQQIGTTSMTRPWALAMVIITLGLIGYQPSLWLGYHGHGFGGIPRPATKIFTTNSGLNVIVPASEEEVRLWDAPLPAAPLPKHDLELRGENMRDGFRTHVNP